jgi:glycosyltransferase involved in cell wall biosynthesis
MHTDKNPESAFRDMISIIIPTYNRKELLQEAVASCLAQTYGNIEVLVIDDGSTDGTEKVVRELLRGPWAGKVTYHRKANGGASGARNLGLRLARGEYIQYLDSDDLLRPEKLERQMAAIRTANGVIDCCSCFGRIETKAAGWDGARRIGEMCEDHSSYIKRQCERSVHVMSTMAPLWRRLFVTGVPAWREDLTVAEEWEYYIRLLALRPQVAFVEEDLFWARAHEGEQLSKAFGSLRHSLSFYRAIRAVEELLQLTPFWTAEVRAGLLLRARTVYINLLRHGDNESIRDYEHWFLQLTRAVPSRSAAGAVYLRQIIGRDLFLILFDLLSRAPRRAPGHGLVN